MIFQEVKPNENLDVTRFSSGRFCLWEAGILKMGWGKARVRLTPIENDGYVTIDFLGVDWAKSPTSGKTGGLMM